VGLSRTVLDRRIDAGAATTSVHDSEGPSVPDPDSGAIANPDGEGGDLAITLK